MHRFLAIVVALAPACAKPPAGDQLELTEVRTVPIPTMPRYTGATLGPHGDVVAWAMGNAGLLRIEPNGTPHTIQLQGFRGPLAAAFVGPAELEQRPVCCSA